jgi:hypothetical protein
MEIPQNLRGLQQFQARQGFQWAGEGFYPKLDFPASFWDVTGSKDAELRFEPHFPEGRKKHLLGVEGRRREILKKSAADAENAGSFGKSGDGKDGEGKHRGRAGGPDIPEKFPAFRRDFWGKGEGRASYVSAGEGGLSEGGRGLHSFEMLRAKSRIIPFGPDVVDAQRFSEEGGQGHPCSHDRSASRLLAPVNLPHLAGQDFILWQALRIPSGLDAK